VLLELLAYCHEHLWLGDDGEPAVFRI
jgi:hypothetical protein